MESESSLSKRIESFWNGRQTEVFVEPTLEGIEEEQTLCQQRVTSGEEQVFLKEKGYLKSI